MAGRCVIRLEGSKLRLDHVAMAVLDPRTARMEDTRPWWRHRGRNIAAEDDPLGPLKPFDARARRGREERGRVRVSRALVDRADSPVSRILPRYMTAIRSESAGSRRDRGR